MTLHLVDSWLDLGSLKQLVCLCDGVVGDSNVFSEFLADSLLHTLQYAWTNIYFTNW